MEEGNGRGASEVENQVLLMRNLAAGFLIIHETFKKPLKTLQTSYELGGRLGS